MSSLWNKIGLTLLVGLAACQGYEVTPLPTDTPTAVVLSETPSPTVSVPVTLTPGPAETSSPVPATPVPYPSERLVFGPPITFINSDGSNSAQFEWLAEYTPADGVDTFLLPSPDGRYLIFLAENHAISCEPPPDSDCPIGAAYFLADLHEQTVASLDGYGSWSPDAREIVISSDNHLIIYELETKITRPLTTDLEGDFYPAWSPDGQWIAFLRPSKECGSESSSCYVSELYLIHPDGTDLRLLLGNVYFLPYLTTAPVWSPNSRWLAVINASGELIVINTSTEEASLVATGLSRDFYSIPAWSPASDQLAFVSEQDGNPEIYVVSIDGLEMTNLTQNPARDFKPSWSLSGRRIAFLSDRELGGASLLVMDLNEMSSNTIPHAPIFTGFAWWPNASP
jgi:TolB protein